MAKRYTKVTVQQLPPVAEWILRRATSAQLDYMVKIASTPDFALMVKIVENLKHYNVYQVFSYKAKDDHDLALYRAAARGEVAGLDALLYAYQGAKLEIERRKNG